MMNRQHPYDRDALKIEVSINIPHNHKSHINSYPHLHINLCTISHVLLTARTNMIKPSSGRWSVKTNLTRYSLWPHLWLFELDLAFCVRPDCSWSELAFERFGFLVRLWRFMTRTGFQFSFGNIGCVLFKRTFVTSVSIILFKFCIILDNSKSR